MINDQQDDVFILGIETSCDETAASVVKNGKEIWSNIIYSQIDIHKKYGGVVPEIASRNHIEKISTVVDQALGTAGIPLDQLNGIAVTCGPGLVGALLVGVSYAKSLAYALGLPLLAVHHIEGHICANFIEYPELEPPFMCLVASGGHTHLVKVTSYDQYQVLGKTKDDAVGEAYDKIARALGLGYPGGPQIDRLAREGNPHRVAFPRAMLDQGFDFSFSGVKSAVLNYLNQNKMQGIEVVAADVAASFQQAVVDVLVNKAVCACTENGVGQLALAGGVACNSKLRFEMEKACTAKDIQFYVPSPVLCTDNGAMIGSRGYFHYISGEKQSLALNAYPTFPLGQKCGC